jgi:serine/threonine protein kinase
VEVLAVIGRGGMGEVYRARDTKLKRDVAIKTLPDEFSHDADRLSRFQREAEVLASLNHPNIAAIYDLQEAEGARFLVLELVEGETLAERIARGPIPIDEALQIAKSICEALEAAHEQGIVHRDLKPANIKITPDGKVKVLDFGLARVMSGNASTATVSNSPTLVSGSMAGAIIGTAAYMSPEQAEGLNADSRSDVFSFGCVLYEMLTGRQLFQGDSAAKILSGVLIGQPDFTALPPKLNPRLHDLLRRCLEKNPKRRWQAVGDLRAELETIAAAPYIKDAAVSAAPRRPVAWIVTSAAATVIAALLAIPALKHLWEVPPTPPEVRTDITAAQTSDLLSSISFALSPDGKQIVYVAAGDGPQRLWVRPLDKTMAQPLAGTEGATFPFWSPDSRSLGFFADRKLKRIDIAGGSPQTLADAYNRGGTWNADGVILFMPNEASPIFRISASGGPATAVTKLEKQSGLVSPQFLPGGRQFLFFAVGSAETQGIYLGSLDRLDTKRLTAADEYSPFLTFPPGWLLFRRTGTLVAQRLDPARGELEGEPVTVADPDIANALWVSAAGGRIAYRGGAYRRTQLAWFDRLGKALGTLGAPDLYMGLPSLSPDGRRVAVARTVQNNMDIWLLDGERMTRFTFDTSPDIFPIWSPDGSRIVFDSNRKGHRDLYWKSSNGASTEELLLESGQDKTASDWSADGRFLLYYSRDPQTSLDIWALPLQGDRKPFVFLKTNFNEYRPRFSPDGRWVAYMSNESGRFEIYVRPFPGPGGQWQISTAGGITPVWAPGGKELYYLAPDGTLMAAGIAVSGATIVPGSPSALFHTHIVGGGTDVNGGRSYDVSRDGRFLILTILEDASTSPITLIQNWTAFKP